MTRERGQLRLTDGELWTRGELERLRARRFGAAAIGRFLAASQRRSNDTRAARRELTRQSRRWLAVGATAWVLPALGRVEPMRRRWRAGLAWWTLTGLMLDWHLGMFESYDGKPRSLGAADALTLARVWLVPVASDAPSWPVCAAAALSDVLDGRLARRSDPTRAGRDLEGLVDVCFTFAALRGARRRRLLGRVPAGLEVARLSAGTFYAVLVYFAKAQPPSEALVQSARRATVLRAAGLIIATAGRRRAGGTLLGVGSGVSIVLLSLELRRNYGSRQRNHVFSFQTVLRRVPWRST